MWRGVHASLWVGHHAPHTPLQETIYAPIPLRFTPLLPHFYIPYYVSTVFTPLMAIFGARYLHLPLPVSRFPMRLFFRGAPPPPSRVKAVYKYLVVKVGGLSYSK